MSLYKALFVFLFRSFQFPERFQELIRRFLSDLTQLCLFCCNDGPASLERIVQNRLEAISGDVSSLIRVSYFMLQGFVLLVCPGFSIYICLSAKSYMNGQLVCNGRER